MQRLILSSTAGLVGALFCVALAASSAYAAIGDHDWSQGNGGNLNGRADVSGAGHTSVYGIFFGTVDFGGGSRVGGNGDIGDVFVARYSPTGAYIWDNQYTPVGTGGVFNHHIAVDPAGNTYLSGTLTSSTDIDFGGGPIMGPQGFIAKFDGNGDHEWSFGFGDATLKSLDANNTHVVGVGYLNSGGAGADFGGGLITPVGSYDVAVAQFTESGGHDWSTGLGDGDDQKANSVTLDASGNVTLTGVFSGSINGISAPSAPDAYVASFTSTGSSRWTTVVEGGFSAASEVHVAAADGNRTILAGEYTTSVDLGGATFSSEGSFDIFLGAFDANGAHQWSNSYGTTSIEDIDDVSASDSTGILISGRCAADMDLGGGMLPTTSSLFNLFIGVFDLTGAHVYSNAYGTTSYIQNAFDQAGDIYLHGAQGTTNADFGGGALNGVNLAMARLAGGSTSGSPPTGIKDVPQHAPISLRAYPNPFNPSTTITYELDRESTVTLQVVDVRGRVVDTLVARESKSAGIHTATFRTDLATGIYFAQVQTDHGTHTAKIALVK